MDRAAAAFGTFALIGTGRIRQSEQSFLPPSFIPSGPLGRPLKPTPDGLTYKTQALDGGWGLTNVDIAKKFYKI